MDNDLHQMTAQSKTSLPEDIQTQNLSGDNVAHSLKNATLDHNSSHAQEGLACGDSHNVSTVSALASSISTTEDTDSTTLNDKGPTKHHLHKGELASSLNDELNLLHGALVHNLPNTKNSATKNSVSQDNVLKDCPEVKDYQVGQEGGENLSSLESLSTSISTSSSASIPTSTPVSAPKINADNTLSPEHALSSKSSLHLDSAPCAKTSKDALTCAYLASLNQPPINQDYQDRRARAEAHMESILSGTHGCHDALAPEDCSDSSSDYFATSCTDPCPDLAIASCADSGVDTYTKGDTGATTVANSENGKDSVSGIRDSNGRGPSGSVGAVGSVSTGGSVGPSFDANGHGTLDDSSNEFYFHKASPSLFATQTTNQGIIEEPVQFSVPNDGAEHSIFEPLFKTPYSSVDWNNCPQDKCSVNTSAKTPDHMQDYEKEHQNHLKFSQSDAAAIYAAAAADESSALSIFKSLNKKEEFQAKVDYLKERESRAAIQSKASELKCAYNSEPVADNFAPNPNLGAKNNSYAHENSYANEGAYAQNNNLESLGSRKERGGGVISHAMLNGSSSFAQNDKVNSQMYFSNGNRVIRKAVIVSKVYHRPVGGAIVEVVRLLNNLGVEAYTDQSTAIGFNLEDVPVISRRGMKETDLIIVVGGDGSVLGASRSLVDLQVPVLGINRGHLGLLTDISPNNIEDALTKVVSGNYTTEKRMMIDVRVLRRDEEGSEELIGQSLALNETVIHSGILAHMIVCRVSINGRYMYTMRSDGIIVGTPTGSTAYSLSAGGPIIEPHLDVLCLVPMFPQSLNCSPIILPGKSNVEIEFEIKDSMPEWVNVNCDGQITIRADTKCLVNIRQHSNQLQLIHPAGYDYYSVLRQKLGWGQSLVN